MKRVTGAAAALLAVAAIATATPGHTYGPGGCVALELSDTGSCVLRTNCKGHDLGNFDFAFDCVAPSEERTRHSFGVGSFDEEEDFDSGVQCERCEVPGTPSGKGRATRVRGARGAPPQRTLAKSAPANKAEKVPATTHLVAAPRMVTRAKTEAAPGGNRARYGPSECVSTWPSATGTCMMETNCASTIDLSSYEFGFLCVGPQNELARHLFGRDSFGHNETFDTLIKCTHCLGLDAIVGYDGLNEDNSGLQAMQEEMTAMKHQLVAVQASVTQLSDAVARIDAAQAPAAAAASPAAPLPPAVTLAVASPKPASSLLGHSQSTASPPAAASVAGDQKRTAAKAGAATQGGTGVVPAKEAIPAKQGAVAAKHATVATKQGAADQEDDSDDSDDSSDDGGDES